MKTRIIHTKFWKDTWVSSLSPQSKLLFLYCISNERLGLTGVFEIPLSHIVIETGLTKKEVQEALKEISTKVGYIEGHIVLLNHDKYQNYKTGSDRQKKAYRKEYDFLPDPCKSALENKKLTSWQLVGNWLATSQNTEIRKQNTKYRGEHLKISEYLFSLIHENNEYVKRPNLELWAEEIEKMERIDKIPLERIEKMCAWCQQDSFWQKNVQSASALRKHFAKMYASAKTQYLQEKANPPPRIYRTDRRKNLPS